MLTRRGQWRTLAGTLFALALGVGLFGWRMEVEVGGRTYTYGPHGDISVQEFYEMQKRGILQPPRKLTLAFIFRILNPLPA